MILTIDGSPEGVVITRPHRDRMYDGGKITPESASRLARAMAKADGWMKDWDEHNWTWIRR